ncbi:ATP-binding cassette domain-containing protein [Streptomyces sp. HPF1205]|uniref:ATP-binding cassette domain-containing protein n=1 Tax=Streptomyces sp. HPF1205 TaxID=2873262 RepID=UPI001CEC1126|nr:ATP-binding cassette domain-containing protein [Streptomyces sp. HPF1205]
MAASILVQGLVKRLGKKLVLDGLSMSAEAGTVVALLGPNGAGKTTTVRVLSTLLRPDAGRVEVCGIDVGAEPRRVRSMIGLTGQFAAVDGILTGRENLELVGRLYRIGRADARRRADDLLERLGLSEAAGQLVKTYSGGMRRRLDLAASLLIRPRVLFLDEPTTGLDLRSRIDLWSEIDLLVRDGTTLLLTTQYLEEADRLADSVTVIDRGTMVAQGTPAELKEQVGGDRVTFTLADPADLDRAADALAGHGGKEPFRDRTRAELTLRLEGGLDTVATMTRELNEAGIDDVVHTVRRPTLDDVFLELTGATAAEAADEANERGTRARGRRGKPSVPDRNGAGR